MQGSIHLLSFVSFHRTKSILLSTQKKHRKTRGLLTYRYAVCPVCKFFMLLFHVSVSTPLYSFIGGAGGSWIT